MGKERVDKELEQYRGLLKRSETFEGGFGWTTIMGILFCGLIITPGGIYLGLMTGQGLAAASTWVTVILFGEVARRALKSMSKGNLVVLLHAATVMMAGGAGGGVGGGPFAEMIYRAFFVTSDAVRDSGMSEAFPRWWVPAPDSPAIVERMLWHRDWIPPIALVLFGIFTGLVNKYTVGYFLFRVTSDIERLPFPMAPISAQGVLAMTEMNEKRDDDEKRKTLLKRTRDAVARSVAKEEAAADGAPSKRFARWRLFSFGAVLGLGFGIVQLGVPLISGLFLDKPIMLLPLPFLDLTTLTEGILPATPTGLTIDLGFLILGMVLPFWSIIGTAIAVIATLVLNPIMHNYGILTQWQPGMDTVNTTFVNSVDFWLSFGLGTTFAIALISVYSSVRGCIRASRQRRAQRMAMADMAKSSDPDARYEREIASLWKTPHVGRGDYPMWLALVLYAVTATAMVLVVNRLIPGLLPFMIIFVFLYNPFISYISARLLAISGQQVDVPFIRESVILASGARGVDIWVAPIPIQNYGNMAQSYRVNELVGVNFRSLILTDIVATPAMLIFSFLFWAFIWRADPIPSAVFPAAQVQWELNSKNHALIYSSTFVPPGSNPDEHSVADTSFMQAIHPRVIALGAVLTTGGFMVLSFLGMPTLLVYGVVRGLGQFPHFLVLQIVGACIGRFYFQKKFGASEFLRMVPTLLAGYFTGIGLLSMAMVAINLISKAVVTAPF